LKKLRKQADLEGRNLWYPDEAFVIETHKEMLEKYGGYPGFERGIIQFHIVLEEVKKSRGDVHTKAAIFLQRLVNVRIFKDGNHRTAYEVTDTFLRMNGARININDEKEIIRFIKHIKEYTIEQVEGWLENGKVP
jgi:death-on-curing family protein